MDPRPSARLGQQTGGGACHGGLRKAQQSVERLGEFALRWPGTEVLFDCCQVLAQITQLLFDPAPTRRPALAPVRV
jgi:hypothetical protein